VTRINTSVEAADNRRIAEEKMTFCDVIIPGGGGNGELSIERDEVLGRGVTTWRSGPTRAQTRPRLIVVTGAVKGKRDVGCGCVVTAE